MMLGQERGKPRRQFDAVHQVQLDSEEDQKESKRHHLHSPHDHGRLVTLVTQMEKQLEEMVVQSVEASGGVYCSRPLVPWLCLPRKPGLH